MKNNAYRRRRVIVSAVKKSHARIPVACALKNVVQLGPDRRGGGLGGGYGVRSWPRRARPDASTLRRCVDAPARVLACQPDDELDNLGGHRGAARMAAEIGPAAS